MTKKNTAILTRIGPKLPKWYARTMTAIIVVLCLSATALATSGGSGV